MTSKNAQSVEEIFGDMVESTTNWGKANAAFYEWERDFKGESDLSDDERMIWVEGYLQALRDAK